MEEFYSHDWLEHTLDSVKAPHKRLDVIPIQEEQADDWLNESLSMQHELARSLTSRWFSHEARPSKKLSEGVFEDLVGSVLGHLFETRKIVYRSDVAAALDLDNTFVGTIFAKFVRQGKLRESFVRASSALSKQELSDLAVSEKELRRGRGKCFRNVKSLLADLDED